MNQSSTWPSLAVVFVSYLESKRNISKNYGNSKLHLSLRFRHCSFLMRQIQLSRGPFPPGWLFEGCVHGVEKHTFRSKSAVQTDSPAAVHDPGLVSSLSLNLQTGLGSYPRVRCTMPSTPHTLRMRIPAHLGTATWKLKLLQVRAGHFLLHVCIWKWEYET